MFMFFAAGVRTLIPGVLPLRAGVSKISACSSGAGTGGDESGEVLSRYFLLVVRGVCVEALGSGRREEGCAWGVAWRR